MGANDFGRFNYTVQECREGLLRDMAEFGERYTMLAKAFELLETTQENQELVRQWFDLYMRVIDESSYYKFGRKMEELEKQIELAWNRGRNANSLSMR